jgi:hypothetical protein
MRRRAATSGYFEKPAEGRRLRRRQYHGKSASTDHLHVAQKISATPATFG